MPKNDKHYYNLLVGAAVLIDWPNRWKNCDPEFRESMRQTASTSSPRFGETGTIVAYNPNDENGYTLQVLLNGSGQLEHFHEGAVTVTSLPNASSTTDRLLADILEELRCKL